MADNTRTPVTEGLIAPRGTVVPCWLCGTHQNLDQMVPDGGSACDDIRWYCRNTLACTERWTSAPGQTPAEGASPGDASAALAIQAAKAAAPGSTGRYQGEGST
jgi:hypothetical protein